MSTLLPPRTEAGAPAVFVDRHIGLDAAARALMLETVGYDSVDALVETAVPASIHVQPRAASSIPPAATEAEALAELRELATANRSARPLIGLGYYDTFTPSVIARNVLENPSWYTAYTPYQPEISQGRLEALITFQTMVTDLTGLATANASMLDEATGSGKLVGVCTIYDPSYPDPRRQRLAVTALAALNDVLLRLAIGRGLPVIDLRLVCSQPADYANPIEPSARGGEKIAASIASLVLNHDFAAGRTAVFR